MLAVLTPFEGKAWALDRWLGALRQTGLPEGTRLVWLCNSPDDDFYRRLGDAAAAMPWDVTLWQDTNRATGSGFFPTDDTVSRLWRELRKRIPGVDIGHILCLEDDVLLAGGVVAELLAVSAQYGPMAAIGAPVPERVPSSGAYMVWLHPATSGGEVRAEGYEPVRATPVEVGGLSFGCTLFPRSLFDLLSLRADPVRVMTPDKHNSRGFWGYDNEACDEVRRRGGQVIAAWGVVVCHMERPAVSSAPIQKPFHGGNSPRPQETQKQKIARNRRMSYYERAWRGIR